jgi:hypothetical protein
MYLENNDNKISVEVSPSNNLKYIFNQEVTLEKDPKDQKNFDKDYF